ncbi:MAG: MerR family transcriptional regulator [bacterium]|nr:MerR family transcriptional regulator [bacterium]
MIYSELNLLRQRSFTFEKAAKCVNGLTTKNIHDWDQAGLLTHQRSRANKGWRRFSILDIHTLMMIAAMKEIGMAADAIKCVLDDMRNDDFYNLDHDPTINAYETVSLVALTERRDYYLVIMFKGPKAFYMNSSEFRKRVLAESRYRAFVTVPFSDYLTLAINTVLADGGDEGAAFEPLRKAARAIRDLINDTRAEVSK